MSFRFSKLTWSVSKVTNCLITDMAITSVDVYGGGIGCPGGIYLIGRCPNGLVALIQVCLFASYFGLI